MEIKLTKVLDAETLRSILDENSPVESIVENLFLKGQELSSHVRSNEFNNLEELRAAQNSGQTCLVELEGLSKMDSTDVVILTNCPMAEQMAKLNVDGKAPACHKGIVETYKQQNPGSNAILHPGCIAHQVARQLIAKEVKINGKNCLNYYQLACRSLATGKVVYDDNGLAAIGMTKEKADELIEGFACLYVIINQD